MSKPKHLKHNVGESNYAKLAIQPWQIWDAWLLDPWDADIIKRVGRNKKGKTWEESRIEDYEKIKHICDHQIYRIKSGAKREK